MELKAFTLQTVEQGASQMTFGKLGRILTTQQLSSFQQIPTEHSKIT
jgi:hypothetical protein